METCHCSNSDLGDKNWREADIDSSEYFSLHYTLLIKNQFIRNQMLDNHKFKKLLQVQERVKQL